MGFLQSALVALFEGMKSLGGIVLSGYLVQMDVRLRSPQVHNKRTIKMKVSNPAKKAKFGSFCVNLQVFLVTSST